LGRPMGGRRTPIPRGLQAQAAHEVGMSTPSNAELDAKIIRMERKGRFLLFSELEAQSDKEWLVHNLLGHAEASAMYGRPGDGKSVLAEDLALHVAAGW